MLVVVPVLAVSYSTYGTVKALVLATDHPALSKREEVGGSSSEHPRESSSSITLLGGLLCGSLSGG